MYRLSVIITWRGTLWQRETYDFLLGESSASRRSAAILPFGEDILKMYETLSLLKKICQSLAVLSREVRVVSVAKGESEFSGEN